MISAAELRWVLVFLLPSFGQQTSSGLFSVKVQSPVSGLLGSSVSLPCALENNMDARPLEVLWYRPKMQNSPVLFYKNSQIQRSPVDVQYQGRVFLLGELVKGDVSVKLENLTLADRGDYVCHVISENWYDKATVSLRVRAVGSTPVISLNEAGAGQMNVSCKSHGWLPKPSIIWTDQDGRDLKHLSKDKFTNHSEGCVDVSSWLIVSPSESEWISCSVGLSGPERKDSRMMLYVPAGVTESLNGFLVAIPVLLLCAAGIAAYCVLRKKGLILSKSKEEENTGRTLPETEPLNQLHVENQDPNEATPTNPVLHTVAVDLDQVKHFKVNIAIDPDETPQSLTHEGNEVKCAEPRQNWDSTNPDDDKIFTLCKEQFHSGQRYWEVKVEGGEASASRKKLSWFVGVASDAAERMYNTAFTPQNEFWVLCYETETGLYIRDQTGLISLPELQKELTAVGVFLDCEKHTLSFYNIKTQSHIYTFTNVEPRTSLRPLISPGVRDTYPLHILQNY